jgi:hypothetical protein
MPVSCCRPLAGGDIEQCHTLSILEGFCDCLDWAKHHVCAHLLAAQHHPVYGPKFGLQLPVPSDGLDSHIAVQRAVPLGLPEGIREPLLTFNVEAEVRSLKAVRDVVKAVEASKTPTTATSSEWQRLVSQMASTAKHLPDDFKEQHMQSLKSMADTCSAAVPAFAKQAAPLHHGNRQDSDRTLKPLYARRMSKVATQPQVGISKAAVCG